MTDDDRLRVLVRSAIERAERDVDVEGDLAVVRGRTPDPAHSIDPRRSRRTAMTLVAAALVIAVVAGVALLPDRGDRGEVVMESPTVPSAELAPTTPTTPVSSAAPSTDPGRPATTPAATASTIAPTTSLDPPATTVPPPPDPSSFIRTAPVDGHVLLSGASALQPAAFVGQVTVPFTGDVDATGRAADGGRYFASFDSGEVVVIGLDGEVRARTNIATSLDDRTLWSITVGPQGVVYAHYGVITDGGADATIAAFAPGEIRPIRTWASAEICESVEFCHLELGPDGVTGVASVPYVDRSGVEIDDAGWVPPTHFLPTWRPAGAPPTAVDLVGPIDPSTGEPTGEIPWTLTLDPAAFDNDLGRNFERQADASFLGTALVGDDALEESDRDVRPAVLWLDGRGVVAIDHASIPGLVAVEVGPDSTLVGFADTADGIVVGGIRPIGG